MDSNIVLQEFTCDDCSLDFTDYKQFLLHRKYHTSLFRTVITEEILLEESCPLCFAKYVEKYKEKCLEDHLGSGRTFTEYKQEFISKQVVRCKYFPKCDAEFNGYLDFTKHVKEVHNDDQPYECQQCSYTTTQYEHLKRHLIAHIKRFKCHLCPKEYRAKWILERHLVRHEEGNIKSSDCSYCGKKCADPNDLRRHLKIHFPTLRTTKCHLCSKKLSSKKYLELHLKGHYKMFKCHLCPKEYTKTVSLKQHLLSHDNINIKSHDCSYCGKKFAVPHILKAHLRVHVPTPENFKCHLCSKGLSSKQKLKDHLVRHDNSQKNVKDFICGICPKRFSSRESLKEHASVHTGDKPFNCDYCDKKFYKPSQRNKHQLVHRDEKNVKKNRTLRQSLQGIN